MKITVKLLKAKGACAEQVAIFKTLFPNGVEPTEELCLAHAQTFGWDWAAANLLPALASKAYDEADALASKAYDEADALASKAYDEADAPARKAYDEAVALALKACAFDPTPEQWHKIHADPQYGEATAPARKAYDEAVAPAAKAYVEATAPARKAFVEAIARAFGRIVGGL